MQYGSKHKNSANPHKTSSITSTNNLQNNTAAAEDSNAMNLTDMLEGAKGARKSDDITATLMRMTVTPNKKQQHKHKQDAPKKLQMAMKKGLENYISKGRRAPVPSTTGNPISAVVQRRTERSDTLQGTGGNGNGSARSKPDGNGVSNNNKWSTPNPMKGNKSRRSASNNNGQNKKPRSNNDDSEGEESAQQNQGSKEMAEQGDFVVDLETMNASLNKKSMRDKAAKKKADKKKQEASNEKTTK